MRMTNADRVVMRRDRRTGRYVAQTPQWRRRHQLGAAWGPLATAAASALAPAGAGGSAAPPGMGTQPGGQRTAVSATFQQSFNPNVSPVFTQVQDSPGSTNVATTSQRAGGGQSAAPSASTSDFPSLPSPLVRPTSPLPNTSGRYGDGDTVRETLRYAADRENAIPWNTLIVGGLALAGGALLLTAFNKRQRRR